MEEKKIKLEFTEEEIKVIYTGLLEVPAKYSLSVMQYVEKQVKEQLEPKVNKDVKK